MAERTFALRGLDGANPLGFLAALGTVVALHRSKLSTARLRWELSTRWTPIVAGVSAPDEDRFASTIADALRGRAVARSAERGRREAERAVQRAKTAIKKKRQDIRRRGVRGAERRKVVERELSPLERKYEEERRRWLAVLREAVPRPELALGRRIEDANPERYRELGEAILADTDGDSRDAADLLAAFGTDACADRDGKLQATPFEFTAGSGWQFFLQDVLRLIQKVDTELVREALFQPWAYRDKRLSLRWDPHEDRRYALHSEDPSKGPAKTMWMANLLGYNALALFPSAPTRNGLETAGWCRDGGRQFFTWPLWEVPLGFEELRSLVGLAELAREGGDPKVLRARGIVAVYRAERVTVGTGTNKKVSFSPARAVWSAGISGGGPRGQAGDCRRPQS